MDAKTRPRRLVSAALLAATISVPTAKANAQTFADLFPPAVPGYGVDPGVTVRSRARPAFDSLGVRTGGVLIHPEIAESVGFDTDVLGGAGDRGSWLIRTAPSVLIQSTARRDPYGLYFSLDDARYPGLPAQNRTDWTAGGGATFALGEGSLTLGAAHLSLHQARDDLDALPTDRPVAYQVNDLRAGYATTLGRLTLEPNVDVATWRFGTASILGAPVAQDYRNRDVVRGGLTLRYATAPQHSFVLALRGAGQFYSATPAGTPSPDSGSFALLAGIDDGSDGLWHYRLLVGYERREFTNAAYPAHGAVVAEADAIFTPGGMTTVTATLSRSIEDAAQEGVGGFVLTSATMAVDYEWRRDLLLRASAGIQHADLLDGGRQTALRGGLQATWLLNRHLRVIGSYDLVDVRATGRAGGLPGSFVRSVGLLTVRLGL